MGSFKQKFILGLATVLALTSVTVGIIGVVTSQDGANNLGVLSASAAIGAVLLTLVYSRLRKTHQEQE